MNVPEPHKSQLKECVFIVEANSNEMVDIWEHFADSRNIHNLPKRYIWGEDNYWWLETVGHINERPINISISRVVIDGYPVLFWDACSQLVDYEMIDIWFKNELPGIRMTDAMNAHIAFHGIDRIKEDI